MVAETILAEFLRCARRLAPSGDAPGRGRKRRRPGLRQEDVAELAGISAGWYARFEAGRARLSYKAIDRIATVLGLEEPQRAKLRYLARPDLAFVTKQRLSGDLNGVGSEIARFGSMARALANASDRREIAMVAARAVHDLIGRESLVYLRDYDERQGRLTIVSAYGKGADALQSHAQPTDAVAYAMRNFHAGRGFGEADLRATPDPDLRRRVKTIGIAAYYSHPILSERGLDFVIGIGYPEPCAPHPMHVGTLDAVAGIVELSLRS